MVGNGNRRRLRRNCHGPAITLSALLGAVVPLVFRALGIDPAVSSGPLITTLNDVLSLVIYFAIAAAVLQVWQ